MIFSFSHKIPFFPALSHVFYPIYHVHSLLFILFVNILGRTIRRYTDASIQLRLESIRNYNIQSSVIPPTDEKGNLRSLIPTLTYDSRDDYFNTHKGTYVELRNALVGTFLGGTVSYNSLSLIGRRFFPATPSLTIAVSAEGGLQNLLQNTTVIPLSERFYTGGPNTLRGYAYQKVGPLDPSGIPLGGRLLLLGNLELRLHIYKIFGVAAFFDTGNVWPTPGDFAFSSLRSDVGLGPRLNTPIGAIRIDYAWKIHRK
jgi:outer membrane protein assembly factor BamA